MNGLLAGAISEIAPNPTPTYSARPVPTENNSLGMFLLGAAVVLLLAVLTYLWVNHRNRMSFKVDEGVYRASKIEKISDGSVTIRQGNSDPITFTLHGKDAG